MSIPYELAKKLKEARFSQFGRSRQFFIHGNLVENPTLASSEDVYCPSLEELILALEPNFLRLQHRFQGDWEASVPSVEGMRELHIAHGDSPTVAAANLWLALNEKKKDV